MLLANLILLFVARRLQGNQEAIQPTVQELHLDTLPISLAKKIEAYH